MYVYLDTLQYRIEEMSGALSGLKVIDFSTLLPGPFATMMLADMGAEVVHIESPNRVDLAGDCTQLSKSQ